MKKLISLLFLLTILFSGTTTKAQWQQLSFPSNNALDRASFPTDLVGFVGNSYYPKLWRTQDGGATWDSITFPNAVHDVDFINADTGFVLYGSSSVYKLSTTYNGGDTWSDQSMPSPGFSYYQMVYFTNVTTGFVNTYDATILQTTNGGANWNTLPFGSYGYLSDKEHINEDTLILTGADGTFMYKGAVYRSDDGGNNWQALIHDSTYTTFDGTHFLNGSLGFAVHSDGWDPIESNLSKTTDGGLSWAIVHSDTGIIYQDVYMNNVNAGYITVSSGTGTSGSILKTNNGITWQTDFTTPYPVRKFYSGGNVLYGIGDGGIVVKNTNVDGINELISEEPEIYPNPSYGFIFPVVKEKTKVNFYNVTGTLVKSVFIQPGERVELQELTNGIYFAEFISENYSGKTKIILAK